MKTSYIYSENRKLRCAFWCLIPQDRTPFYYLQLQRKVFRLFWVRCHYCIGCSELHRGVWGEDTPNPFVQLTHGMSTEVYKPGTLDLKKRIHDLFQVYYKIRLCHDKLVKSFKEGGVA